MTAAQPAAIVAPDARGRQAATFWQGDAVANFNLGVALYQRGRLNAATARYRAALASRPDLAEAHNNLGVALKEQGALDEAIASCQRALEINPGYAQAHNNLGSVLHQRGESERAIAAFRRAGGVRFQLSGSALQSCDGAEGTWRTGRGPGLLSACHRIPVAGKDMAASRVSFMHKESTSTRWPPIVRSWT